MRKFRSGRVGFRQRAPRAAHVPLIERQKPSGEAKRHCSEPTFWTLIAAHLGRDGYEGYSLSCLEIINDKRIHGLSDRGRL